MTKKDTTVAGTEQSKLTESMASSPEKSIRAHAADEMAAVGSTFQLRSEKPTEPPTISPAFAQLDVPNTSVGNVDYTAVLKDEGILGFYLSRDRARRDPIAVTLNLANYTNGMYNTIYDSMFHLLQKKTTLNDFEIAERVAPLSHELTLGCCIATYLKLRPLIISEFPARYNSINLKRPKAITDLPVVAPFAFAIQQLGAVNIVNLRHTRRFVPVLPVIGHTFGVPNEYTWNPNKYAQCVEYARNIGLHFHVVDPKQKNGTAWWLLRQHYAENIFELKLPFPEGNYTSAMALTHSLYLRGNDPDPSNVIFDLNPCGLHDYGYLMRDPHPGIHITTFETIDDSAKEIVSNV